MAKAKTAKTRASKHKDVEFEVSNARGDRQKTFNRFDKAASAAMIIGAGSGRAILDVIIWSRAGAKWWGGDDAVKMYDSDPEASVFERYEISVHAAGKVP